MSYGCFKFSSVFSICFGNCTGKKNSNSLVNKVGSSTNLNEIDNNGIESVVSTNTDSDRIHRKTSLHCDKNGQNHSNDTQNVSQERRASEVIIQQPINKIKIVNVTYQKHYINQSTINKKRISNAIDGHVNSLRQNSTDSNSTNQSPEDPNINTNDDEQDPVQNQQLTNPKRSFWNKRIKRELPPQSTKKQSRVLTAQTLKRLFQRPKTRTSKLVPSLRDRYNISAKKISRLANSALRMGGIRIPEDQRRVSTIKIDSDDEDSFMDDNNEDSVIDEEVEVKDEDEVDDFEEITDQLSDIPVISFPNSLHQSHAQFLGSDNKNVVRDMYDRDTNNNENYLLTDNNNYFYPKSSSLLTKDDWMWKEKRPLGSHAKISPLNGEGDPLKYSSNNYNEFDYDEIMNTEFVGMKRPVILRDELSVKHEELRKNSPQKFNQILSEKVMDPLEIDRANHDDEVLFIDVQDGKEVVMETEHEKEITSDKAASLTDIINRTSDDAESDENMEANTVSIENVAVPNIVEEYNNTDKEEETSAEISDIMDHEEDNIKRSVSFDDSYENVEEFKATSSSFLKVVQEAQKQSVLENEENRPATCIPIITIDHVEDVDIHANENREPKQVAYRDPVTGIPLTSMRNKMHHLSVPRRGRTSKFAEAKPGILTMGHPALLSGKIRKPMGVKRIQYLIEKRERGERKREARRKQKEKHREEETKKKWLRADRIRIAQDAAVEHRNATVAWT